MKKVKLLYIVMLLGITSMAYSQALTSTVYDWDKLSVKKSSTGEVKTFFKSPTKDLEMFEAKAVTLNAGKDIKTYEVAKSTDELLIVKEGIAGIKVNDEMKTLGEGSVVLALAGDKVTIANKEKNNLVYISFIFKPFIQRVPKETDERIFPLFVDWKTVEFKPNANGGRRDIMRRATSSLRELEIHVTTLKEGISSHAPHTHRDEEFVLMRYGTGDMDLDGKHYIGGPGSIFFLASGGYHGINNAGNSACEYFAIRWLTQEEAK